MALSVRIRSAVALAGRYPLLSGADFDARAGEIVALQGPNGAGKTSLLRAMAGLLPLVAGEARVLGLDPSIDARALRAKVGLLGHRNGLYDDLSAEENVRFCARAAKAPTERCTEALECLGIGSRLRALPAGRLSAGQRRRVALAAILARMPELWLLDEPHAGLDADHRQQLDDLLAQVASAGATVVLASHDSHVAGSLASRVATMSGGAVCGGVLDVQHGASTAGNSQQSATPGSETPAEEAVGVA